MMPGTPRSFALIMLLGLMTGGTLQADDSALDRPEVMQAVSLAQWERVLEAKQPGIIVADLWASWCVSCIERFPKMVDLADRFSQRNVTFLTLNLDDPQDASGIEWSNGFLAGLGGTFGHYRLDENLTVAFEALDLMSLPVVLIHDGSGKERHRLTNDNPNQQFTEADIEAALEALLAGAEAP